MPSELLHLYALNIIEMIIAVNGLQRMLNSLATIWRLPEKHENSRLLITV